MKRFIILPGIVALTAGSLVAQPPAQTPPPAGLGRDLTVGGPPPAETALVTRYMPKNGDPTFLLTGISSRHPLPPLVVTDEPWPPDKMDEAREDGAIMMRLLQDALRENRGNSPEGWAMGIPLEEIGAGHGSRVLYLDGYGVVFQLNVNSPLVPPPTGESEEKPKSKDDSAWERARQELYGQPGQLQPPADRSAKPFSADAVERLKSSLVDALGSAANLRPVKSEEWIVVTVVAPGDGGPTLTFHTQNNDPFTANRRVPLDHGHGERVTWAERTPAGRNESIMTLKVRKSDVEAFAGRQLDRVEFGKRVHLITY
jgi:hypothetical protein